MYHNKPIRVFEAFAGFGGASFALKKAGLNHEVVMFSEWDKWAQELFRANHGINIPLFADHDGSLEFLRGDMTRGDINSIPKFDLFTGGFPCQPFSSAGLGKGELDPRGTLFYPIIKIVKKHRPDKILLENVKGMTHKRHRPTFDRILKLLSEQGYVTDYKVLNSTQFGIPQNRERLWIFAEKKVLHKERMKRNNGKSLFEKLINNHAYYPYEKAFFHDFLDPQNNKSVPEKYFLNDDQVKKLIDYHKMPLHEFTTTKHGRSLCLDIYNKKLRQDEISITLTEPHHNSLRVVEKLATHPDHEYTRGEKKRGYTVRKLTISEHYRLMGFENYELNRINQSYYQLCKRAGNGWDINLASLIFREIYS